MRSQNVEFAELLTILMETDTNDLGTFEWWFSLIVDTVLFHTVDRPYPLLKGKPTTSMAPPLVQSESPNLRSFRFYYQMTTEWRP
ncbi:hypothetical protein BLNAU_7837 [Blattamonas nauphoetae]|uniref:Uncharacterized protein n=1 Tax=Blattamonas nauphoetae TaxID=2049346 RepID=A0ABQ9Y0H8_9EUKA|nr:hypothetical protein BLNAU_7837 [Blattamonas nauphoetae]